MGDVGTYADLSSFTTGGQAYDMQDSYPQPVASTSGTNVKPSQSNQKEVTMRKSCQHCRKRKIRCIPSEADESTCKACKHKGQQCVFEKQSTMGRPPKSKKREEGDMSAASPGKSGNEAQKPRKKVKTSPEANGYDEHRRHSAVQMSEHDMLPAIHAPFPQPAAYDWQTRSMIPQPDAFYRQPVYTGYPTAFQQEIPQAAYSPVRLPHIETALPPTHSPVRPTHNDTALPPFSDLRRPSSTAYPAPIPSANPYSSHQADVASASLSQSQITHDPSHLLHLQTQESVFDSFEHEPLRAVVSAFSDLYTSSRPSSASGANVPASLSDPDVPAIAKIRTLTGRAISTRAPHAKKEAPSSADYARSLVSPLWDGLPVDIIALTTTGRPSSSGPFVQSAKGPSSRDRTTSDEYLFTKLLREDESSSFSISEVPADPAGTRTSPYRQYAPTKAAVLQYFEGHFRKHPIAPLLINEKLFRDDLANDALDEVLINVIVGSSIARGPCLGAGGDARDVGEYFFSYIQDTLLSRTFSECIGLNVCQALLLWGTHELAHMRFRRCAALWGAAETLLRERIRRFQAKAAEDLSHAPVDAQGQPTPSGMQWRDIVEQELTVNGLWMLIVFSTWTSLSMRLPHSTMSILAGSLPAPPSNVALSSSFAFSFAGNAKAAPSQHVVRNAISRFADATQLVNVIISIGGQAQAKRLFMPDPPRPLATATEDTQVAGWLLDLARYFSDSPQASPDPAKQTQVATQRTTPESSRTFLIVAHAILALYQLLPLGSGSGEHGVPTPLPTIDSLRTALQALHLLSRSITAIGPSTRTRTQALLLDAMPRVLSLLDIFSTTSMSSLDHFTLVTSNRDIIIELLGDLRQACDALEGSSVGAHAGYKFAMDRASLNLSTIAEMGVGLQHNTDLGQYGAVSQHDHMSWPSLVDVNINQSLVDQQAHQTGAPLAAILDGTASDSSRSSAADSAFSISSLTQEYNQEAPIGDFYTTVPGSNGASPEDVKPFHHKEETQPNHGSMYPGYQQTAFAHMAAPGDWGHTSGSINPQTQAPDGTALQWGFQTPYG